MGSHGIKDQVAIIGMGCTPFTEHWDKSLDDLIIDAAHATYASAGIAHRLRAGRAVVLDSGDRLSVDLQRATHRQPRSRRL